MALVVIVFTTHSKSAMFIIDHRFSPDVVTVVVAYSYD